MSPTCQSPVYEPSRANPAGDCRAPATMAAPLGDTGRWLSYCPRHASWRPNAIPLGEVPEP